MKTRLLIFALAMAPLATSAAQMPEPLDVVESVLGARGEPLRTHAHPAHGQAMTCHDYTLKGARLETVGTSAKARATGMFVLELDDPALAAQLETALVEAYGPASTQRGQSVRSWTVPSSSAAFDTSARLVLAQEEQGFVMRMDRRIGQSDPAARRAVAQQHARSQSAIVRSLPPKERGRKSRSRSAAQTIAD